ncbi:putative membrane protein [Winogradskyella psychrotolerans RS-3]|uniref:Putative membrane protein n=1 Tax=Winogradskyella psychrotolerans RS-3 TaxID=641526 RepID=S7WVD2_9FLAO|nr:lysoplasmalogenase [Winogradskyella psychrotolerans]EPR70684.1 putative membrane protein [Winogradskyella psychrotolerans RS-3]
MLSHTEKLFSILFFIIVLIELVTGSVASLNTIHYIAKPAIVISLSVLFLKTSESLPKTIKNLTLLALFFSVLGDILLMFVDKSSHFFTLGLVAFLTAHVMYVFVFLKHRNKQKSPLGFIAVLLVYAAILFYFLNGNLGDMFIPVVIYMLVILSMATAAYLRKDKVNILSYGLVFLGTILFMISDSILALNKFYASLNYSDYSIMITYALAQYLIVIGILKLKYEVILK